MRTTSAGFKTGRNGKSPSDLLQELGPTLLVDIGFKPLGSSDGKPNLPIKGVRALIDTELAATASTMISPES